MSEGISHKPLWQRELAESYRSVDALVADGYIAPQQAQQNGSVSKTYKILITKYYASLINKDDPNCPIAKQALPDIAELVSQGQPDPLGDLDHQPVGRITHRYENRVLLHLTPNCSMYCRFCFRKSLLNELSSELFRGYLQDTFKYLRAHPEIEEVILSGGDPLMVTDESLFWVWNQLGTIDSIKTVRIHSRVPVTFPSRVDENLCRVIKQQSFKKVIITHFNHPKEITFQAGRAVDLLKKSGATVLNQSVLLKGVNDSADTLVLLSKRLWEVGVLPYYLHHPDPAQGTNHFWIDEEVGLEIYKNIQRRLSGYLVPKYVQEDVSEAFKPMMG